MGKNIQEYTNSELNDSITNLLSEIESHDSRTGDGEMMLKNAVLMNAYTAQIQRRNTDKSGKHSMRIAYIAIGISVASLGFSYFQSQKEITVNFSQINSTLESNTRINNKDEATKNANNNKQPLLKDGTTDTAIKKE